MYIYRYFVPIEESRLGKPNQLPSAGFATPTVADEKVGEGKTMLATPKKSRPRVERLESVQAVLQKKEQEFQSRRVEVALAAEAGEISIKVVQALLDENMRHYLPDLPRVIVTQKPFGMFRKRMLEARVDLTRFLQFVIREWATLAAQNRVAFMRDPSKASRGTPIPAAPTFTTLAYRLPYFIAAYANNLAGPVKKTADAVDPKDLEIQRLQRKLEDMQNVAKSQAKSMRRVRRPEPEEVAPVAPQRKRPSGPVVEEDWVPPSWD